MTYSFKQRLILTNINFTPSTSAFELRQEPSWVVDCTRCFWCKQRFSKRTLRIMREFNTRQRVWRILDCVLTAIMAERRKITKHQPNHFRDVYFLLLRWSRMHSLKRKLRQHRRNVFPDLLAECWVSAEVRLVRWTWDLFVASIILYSRRDGFRRRPKAS